MFLRERTTEKGGEPVAVAKDTLYEYLDHLQDAFLVRTVSMHSRSERKRMANRARRHA